MPYYTERSDPSRLDEIRYEHYNASKLQIQHMYRRTMHYDILYLLGEIERLQQIIDQMQEDNNSNF